MSVTSTAAAADELLDRQVSGANLGAMPRWRLMWWRFRRNRAALVGGVVMVLICLAAVFADFVAPADPNAFNPRFSYVPPQSVAWTPAPVMLGYKSTVDPQTLSKIYVPDDRTRFPVVLFPKVRPYQLWGLIPLEHRLFGVEDARAPFYLAGSDRLGRDILSRMLHGARVSLSIGLFGVVCSLFLGTVIGGISGYFGGRIDFLIQKLIEFILSVPTIPLWLALAASVPKTWDPISTYLLITLILSLIGWTEMARVVRGRFLSLRTEDYVVAARLDGVSEPRIIMRHIMPALTSHIIAAATLAIPVMILSETALSFLGLGLQPPIVSWGVMLQEAQSVRALATAPWLLTPGLCIVVTVLALNFLGDGLRDAADPYGT